jgi:rubrerythrin
LVGSRRRAARTAGEEIIMSRLPRHLEHLRTGFNAEASSAAAFRAYAEQAAAAGRPNLAARWSQLAAEKDRLAIDLLRAAGKIESESANLRSAIAEEQYENEVLYPRLEDDLGHLGHVDEVSLLGRLRETQARHLRELDALRRELTSSAADVRGLGVAQVG